MVGRAGLVLVLGRESSLSSPGVTKIDTNQKFLTVVTNPSMLMVYNIHHLIWRNHQQFSVVSQAPIWLCVDVSPHFCLISHCGH